MVAKSYVVPQRPPRLRTWFWWWWSTHCIVQKAKTFLYSTKKKKKKKKTTTTKCMAYRVQQTLPYSHCREYSYLFIHLMFWVPLSINTCQQGNLCRFYHTRPAILVTVMSPFFYVLSSQSVFVVVVFLFVCLFVCLFGELLSWLGKWTVMF